MNPTTLLPELEAIARRAGEVILAIYRSDFTTRTKADASPVTEADERAEAVIVAALRALTPGIPVVAEEAVAGGACPVVGAEFWLVDPLDGTKEFISRNGEFTVNIALVRDGAPVLGVVLVVLVVLVVILLSLAESPGPLRAWAVRGPWRPDCGWSGRLAA